MLACEINGWLLNGSETTLRSLEETQKRSQFMDNLQEVSR